jgi:hypothetical protein
VGIHLAFRAVRASAASPIGMLPQKIERQPAGTGHRRRPGPAPCSVDTPTPDPYCAGAQLGR